MDQSQHFRRLAWCIVTRLPEASTLVYTVVSTQLSSHACQNLGTKACFTRTGGIVEKC